MKNGNGHNSRHNSRHSSRKTGRPKGRKKDPNDYEDATHVLGDEGFEDKVAHPGPNQQEIVWQIDRLRVRIAEMDVSIERLQEERLRYKKRERDLLDSLHTHLKLKGSAPRGQDRIYAPLTLREKRAQVQDENVGDGSVREIDGKKQFWWRGGWRDV